MKKQLASLALVCVLMVTLSACSESGIAPLDEETSGDVTTQTIEETEESTTEPEPATSNDETQPLIEERLHEGDLNNCYNNKWRGVNSRAFDVVFEREWKDKYETKYGVSYCEVALLQVAAYAENTENGLLSNPEDFSGSVRAYVELTSLDSPLTLMFSDYEHELIWNRVHSGEITWDELNQDTWFVEAIRHFSVTRDEFVRVLNRNLDNDLFWYNYEISSGRTQPEEMTYPTISFTPEEIDILFSGDDMAIKQAALTPWSIMVEGDVYSAQWLIDHDPDDWEDAGITPEEVEESFEIFQVVLEPDEVKTFERDLKEFRRNHGRGRGGQGGRRNQN